MEHLGRIDNDLASRLAAELGMPGPTEQTPNHGRSSPALSQVNQPSSAATRKIAVLAADGLDTEPLRPVLDRLRSEGAICELLAPHGGRLSTADGGSIDVDRSLTTMSSVLYDAVLVGGGEKAVDALLDNGEALHYTSEAYKHAKPIGALHAGVRLLERAPLPGARLAAPGQGLLDADGVVSLTDRSATSEDIDAFAGAFVDAVGGLRYHQRDVDLVPA